jgi:hypothetical protein
MHRYNLQVPVMAIFAVLLMSCKTFQVAENKNLKNTPSLGVEWYYGDRVSPVLQPRIDSVIRLAMDNFNKSSRSFSVHPKQKKDKDYITIDVMRTRKVRTGGKIAGYTISTVGILVAPVAMIVAEVGAILAFAYLPSHRIEARGELSPNLAADKRSFGPVGSEAFALFTKDSKQINRMLTHVEKNVRLALEAVERQLAANP